MILGEIMSEDWADLIGPHGRLSRHPDGRKDAHYLRFHESENPAVAARAQEYGLTVPAFLHIAGRFFVPPSDAPARFHPSTRSRAIDRAIAVDLARVIPDLTGVARNVNQLTRHAHREGRLPSELIAMAAHVERALERADCILDQLDPRDRGR
jgi:hypothetical protein